MLFYEKNAFFAICPPKFARFCHLSSRFAKCPPTVLPFRQVSSRRPPVSPSVLPNLGGRPPEPFLKCGSSVRN